MRLLLGSQDAPLDRLTFLTVQIVFWLLAAPDGHAKNFSVFIERGGRFRLTPLHDIMSAYEWQKKGLRHIRKTARYRIRTDGGRQPVADQ